MTCKELTNDLVLDYVGWRLDPHERNRVARHLDACNPCRARRDELEGMAGALRRSAEAPPAALLAQLDKAVLEAVPRARRAVPPRSLRWLLAVGGVAAAIVIGVVAFVAGSRTGRDRDPSLVREPLPPSPPTAPPERPKKPVEEPVKPTPPPPPPDPAEEPVKAPPPEPKPPPPEPKPVPPGPKPDPVEPPKPAPPRVLVREEPPAPPPPMRGDLNGDGTVDIADARLLQQKITLGHALPATADLNADGAVDIADVREILRAELAVR